MTAVSGDTPWADLNSSGGGSAAPAWKKWAAAAAIVVGGATLATAGGMIPTPPTVPPAGAATFTMTSLLGPQDNVTCGSTNYPTSGWTIVNPTDGAAQSAINNGSVGQKFCLKAGTHRFTDTIVPKDNMQIVGEKGAILDGGVALTGWTEISGKWRAPVPTGLVKQISKRANPEKRCSGVEDGTPDYKKSTSQWPWEPNCIDEWDIWWGGRWVEPEESITCPNPLPGETATSRWTLGNTCVGLDPHDKNAYESPPSADALEYALSGGYFYLGFNPSSTEVIMNRPMEFGLSDRSSGTTHTSSNADNVTIRNIVIQHVGNREQDGALDVQNGGWTIRNVETRYNHGIGLAAYGSVVEYSISHHNGQLQFGAKGNDKPPQKWTGSVASTTPSEWNYNEAHSANLARYWVGWEGGLTKYSKTTNQVFAYNYMHDGPQAGVWFDINNRGAAGWEADESKRNRVIGNWITNQGAYVDPTTDYPLSGSQSVGRGIFLEIGCQALVADNTIVRVGIDKNGKALDRGPSANAGIWITEGHSNVVRDNVVDSSALGIIVTDKGRDDQNGYCSTNNLSTSNSPITDLNGTENFKRIHMPFDNVIDGNKVRMTIGRNGPSDDLRPATGLDANTGISSDWKLSSHTGKWTPGFGTTSRCAARPTGDQFDIDCDRWMEAFEPTPDSGALFPSQSLTSVVRLPNVWLNNHYWVPSALTAGTSLFRWQRFVDGGSPYTGQAAMTSYSWSVWNSAYGSGSPTTNWIYAGQDAGGSYTTQNATDDEPACSLRTPGIFTPTKYEFTPSAGTVDVWVQVDPSDYYKDHFWYIPPSGCAEVKQANSAGLTWVQVEDNQTFSGTQVFGLSRWDDDLVVTKVVTVPNTCSVTSDPEAECSETTLTGTRSNDDTGYTAPTVP